MKDTTRSSVNISSKDQEKLKMFSQGNQRDNWYEGADRGQRNLGRRTRVKDQGDEQVGEKKQTAQQILWGDPGRMLALALSR